MREFKAEGGKMGRGDVSVGQDPHSFFLQSKIVRERIAASKIIQTTQREKREGAGKK